MKPSLFFKNYFRASTKLSPVQIRPSHLQTYSAFNYPLILALALASASALLCYYYDMQSLHFCTNHTEGEVLEDNPYFTIKHAGTNTWNVLFKNVNFNYLVNGVSNSSTNAGESHDFRFRELNSNNVPEGVCHTSNSKDISSAVIAHFNCIQKGEFHFGKPNFINPNAYHGVGKAEASASGSASAPSRGGNFGVSSPVEQFEIISFVSMYAPIIAYLYACLTNIGFYLIIAAFLGLMFNFITTNFKKVIADSWSISQESIYATIHGIVINQINAKKGQMFFPIIYSIFVFILVNNLVGMIPYSFASTAHFMLTFFISFTVVMASTLLGTEKFKQTFTSLLVPLGCPLGLLPLLVMIESISYLARNVSLGLRLAANVLSGHMLLNILSGFVYNIMKSGYFNFILSLIPLAFITAFSGLELAIAFIQSQVFVVLSCSYIKDGVKSH